MGKSMPILVFVGSFLDAFVKLGLVTILVGTKGIYKQKRFWVSTIVLAIYVFFSYMITDNVIRTIIYFFIPIVLCKYIIRNISINKIFITTFCVWIVLALLDSLCGLIFNFILNIDINTYRQNGYIVFFINCLIFMLTSLVFLFKNTRSIVNKISDFNLSGSNNYVMFVVILSVILFSTIFYVCQFNYSTKIILLVSFITVVIYTVIVIITIKQFNDKHKLQAEYEILSTNLTEYENLLDRQRILNHENKNQLLVIKGMINKKETNVSEYIDTIIDTQYVDNEVLIMKTNRIPSGGLKGLIYYKMLSMKDKKINVTLDVDSSLRSLDFNLISVRTNQELCKIVGVFIDNAIEEVSKLKEKNVNISLSYDESLIIKVSNNYEGNINLDKIDNSGYTTKGSGHGYGLSLVKNIIKNNSLFENSKVINGKVFTQIVKLDIQKTD